MLIASTKVENVLAGELKSSSF